MNFTYPLFLTLLSKGMVKVKRRPDGRWQKRIKLPNGKSKLLYSTASTERLANKDFNEQMLALDTEEKNKTKFAAVANEWNDRYRERIGDINYKKATKSTYEKVIDHFGHMYITDITTDDINKYLLLLEKKGYKKKTIATNKNVLNMIFNDAALNYNPVTGIRLSKDLASKKRDLPSDAELKIINDNYIGEDFLPYFLLNTGLRKSEALALKYENIDFDKKVIHVIYKLIHDGNKCVMSDNLKSINADRDVILLDRVAEKIPKNKKGFLFCRENGEPLTKRAYDIRWEKWQKKYNTKITAHQLRHGYATMLFEADINERDAQELMGHSDITLTRRVYTHIRNKHKEETANKLNNFTF